MAGAPGGMLGGLRLCPGEAAGVIWAAAFPSPQRGTVCFSGASGAETVQASHTDFLHYTRSKLRLLPDGCVDLIIKVLKTF